MNPTYPTLSTIEAQIIADAVMVRLQALRDLIFSLLDELKRFATLVAETERDLLFN